MLVSPLPPKAGSRSSATKSHADNYWVDGNCKSADSERALQLDPTYAPPDLLAALASVVEFRAASFGDLLRQRLGRGVCRVVRARRGGLRSSSARSKGAR